MRARTRVALLFGGQSAEHDVSCVSARHVAAAMDPSRYLVVPIGITREGEWVLPLASERALHGEPLPVPDDGFKGEGRPLPMFGFLRPGPVPQAFDLGVFDVVFPVLHGPHGEDGTVQGLLELAGCAYVGSGVLGSALAMDKVMMKVAFSSAGIPNAKSVVISAHAWEAERQALIGQVEELGFPCFTKPANMGSSVGISRCIDEQSLLEGVELALSYDTKVLVEEGIAGREIECAVLGNESPEASVCGEIIPGRDFYDYEAKYIEPSSKILVPADLPERASKAIRSYAVAAFLAVGAAGLSRVDFFYDEGGRGVVINEINTMPGFTEISMFPKLWAATGVSYPDLIDRLIELALERHASRPSSSPAEDLPGHRSAAS